MLTKTYPTYASPSLEATMNHGLYGCAGLTPASEAVSLRCALVCGARGAEKLAPARTKGFSASLYGRLQRV
ncbi:MAG TPA: hypothetical protein PLK80_19275 [bacterium]|nr:hypothetical protein [bacterium]